MTLGELIEVLATVDWDGLNDYLDDDNDDDED